MASVPSSERWSANWRVLSPKGSVRLVLGGTSDAVRATEERARDLPSGTPVVIVAGAPRAATRCRTFAARTDIEIEREYVALPSAAAPAYLIEDARETFRVFVDQVQASPSRGLVGLTHDAAQQLMRALRPRRLIASFAAGRVAVGRRG
jgi:hypothetical protein